MRSIDSLVAYDRNARKHSAKQIAKLAESIREFGFNAPVLVDAAGVIIAGHGRVEAARKVGLKTLPVIPLEHLTDAQRRAYIIADNRISDEAGWDDDLLAEEMAALSAEGFDLALTGFDIPEIDEFLQHAAAPVDERADETPEPPAIPVSRPGDLWRLGWGGHRIICGDSTDAATVERLLAGVKPHLMVTDPPYGVEYDANWRNEADRANGKPYGARAVGQVLNDSRADWREAWALFPGDVAYVWHAGKFAGLVAESLQAAKFDVRSQIIWAKNSLAISRGDYHWQHEPCWYAVRAKATSHWSGDRKQSTLWQIDKPKKSETGHSTQKPVECMARPIKNNSSPGQAVYEPFSGSGTTIIAAEQLGRVCYAVELNPAYVDVAVRRWQDFAPGVATLEGDGRTFDEIAAERLAEAA
jgi:DNA modification methylase